MFNQFAKSIIIFGVVLVAIGAGILLASKFGKLPKLPGDIYIKRENFTFYFPIVTCLIISMIVSIILYFVRK